RRQLVPTNGPKLEGHLRAEEHPSLPGAEDRAAWVAEQPGDALGTDRRGRHPHRTTRRLDRPRGRGGVVGRDRDEPRGRAAPALAETGNRAAVEREPVLREAPAEQRAVEGPRRRGVVARHLGPARRAGRIAPYSHYLVLPVVWSSRLSPCFEIVTYVVM